MSDKPISLTPAEEEALWEQARLCLSLTQTKPAISTALVDRLHAQLPPKQQDENMGDWLRRASTGTVDTTADVLPFRPSSSSSRRLTPLSEFVRLAADSSGSELSLPDSALESSDGRFRLRVLADSSGVTVFIEALGLAADQFAHSCIGLLNPDNTDEPLLTIDLDQDGDGHCRIEDTPALRRALLNPVILLIE